MADLIDRKAVIDSIPEARADIFENCYRCTLLTREEVVEIVEGIPTAERTSEWELIDGAEPRRYGCKKCKCLSWYESAYCPNCGARMESES